MENKELKERFIDENTGIEYVRQGDYYIPNLVVPENIKNFKIGKYGNLRLRYLKEHKKALYTTLLMKDELTNHLVSVSKNAENLLNNLMESYKNSDEKLYEKNKETNQFEWVKLMNNYKNAAEEIVLWDGAISECFAPSISMKGMVNAQCLEFV